MSPAYPCPVTGRQGSGWAGLSLKPKPRGGRFALAPFSVLTHALLRHCVPPFTVAPCCQGATCANRHCFPGQCSRVSFSPAFRRLQLEFARELRRETDRPQVAGRGPGIVAAAAAATSNRQRRRSTRAPPSVLASPELDRRRASNAGPTTLSAVSARWLTSSALQIYREEIGPSNSRGPCMKNCCVSSSRRPTAWTTSSERSRAPAASPRSARRLCRLLETGLCCPAGSPPTPAVYQHCLQLPPSRALLSRRTLRPPRYVPPRSRPGQDVASTKLTRMAGSA